MEMPASFHLELANLQVSKSWLVPDPFQGLNGFSCLRFCSWEYAVWIPPLKSLKHLFGVNRGSCNLPRFCPVQHSPWLQRTSTQNVTLPILQIPEFSGGLCTTFLNCMVAYFQFVQEPAYISVWHVRDLSFRLFVPRFSWCSRQCHFQGSVPRVQLR